MRGYPFTGMECIKKISTQEANGVTYVTQHPILPHHKFSYNLRLFQLVHIGIMHTVGLKELMDCMEPL